jgi:hypothetical protein
MTELVADGKQIRRLWRRMTILWEGMRDAAGVEKRVAGRLGMEINRIGA